MEQIEKYTFSLERRFFQIGLQITELLGNTHKIQTNLEPPTVFEFG